MKLQNASRKESKLHTIECTRGARARRKEKGHFPLPFIGIGFWFSNIETSFVPHYSLSDTKIQYITMNLDRKSLNQNQIYAQIWKWNLRWPPYQIGSTTLSSSEQFDWPILEFFQSVDFVLSRRNWFISVVYNNSFLFCQSHAVIIFLFRCCFVTWLLFFARFLSFILRYYTFEHAFVTSSFFATQTSDNCEMSCVSFQFFRGNGKFFNNVVDFVVGNCVFTAQITDHGSNEGSIEKRSLWGERLHPQSQGYLFAYSLFLCNI